MDNKKLFKFLYKDIAEIEELFTEKGSEGFDEFEIEFIQSRFAGAKQLIQILSEKENKQLKKIRPKPVVKETQEEVVIDVAEEEEKKVEVQQEPEQVEEKPEVKQEEAERLESLSEFEKELKDNKLAKVGEEKEEKPVEVLEETEIIEEPEQETKVEAKEKEKSTEEDAEKKGAADSRLGDSFVKEKSVNDLMGGEGNNLEQKISNSPVENINAAIGINDRYLFIRELFEGNADTFNATVADLDKLNNIKEAVSYLQENFKWKKNETSLKFVNLVKRRFPNG